MRRSAAAFVAALALSIPASPLVAHAQPPVKIPRIGYLGGSPSSPGDEAKIFREGLRELDWCRDASPSTSTRS